MVLYWAFDKRTITINQSIEDFTCHLLAGFKEKSKVNIAFEENSIKLRHIGLFDNDNIV